MRKMRIYEQGNKLLIITSDKAICQSASGRIEEKIFSSVSASRLYAAFIKHYYPEFMRISRSKYPQRINTILKLKSA